MTPVQVSAGPGAWKHVLRRRHLPGHSGHRLRLYVSVKKVIIESKCGQRLLEIEEIVLDHIEHILLEAGVARQTALTTIDRPELAGPVSQALHGREDPVRKILPLILQLHYSYNIVYWTVYKDI